MHQPFIIVFMRDAEVLIFRSIWKAYDAHSEKNKRLSRSLKNLVLCSYSFMALSILMVSCFFMESNLFLIHEAIGDLLPSSGCHSNWNRNLYPYSKTKNPKSKAAFSKECDKVRKAKNEHFWTFPIPKINSISLTLETATSESSRTRRKIWILVSEIRHCLIPMA